MVIPHNIDKNTYLAYKSTNDLEPDRILKSEWFEWDQNHPKSLAFICLTSLSNGWTGFPKLDELVPKDRELFLTILSTTTPLQRTMADLHICCDPRICQSSLVDNIESDIFWKKCYESRWNNPLLKKNDKNWKNLFVERHYAEILENMNPKDYDPEQINTLVKLCYPYVQSLSIRSLVPSDIFVQRISSPEMEHLITSQGQFEQKAFTKNEPLTRDHISLHAVLGSLTNLVELHITYQLKYIGMDYRGDQFQFTFDDVKNLSRGLEKCVHLRILRITRSDLNCQKTKYILRGLSDTQNLETLDFSHCRIADDGASSLAKFISKREILRNLTLCCNLIGSTGAENIALALNSPRCGLRSLDLRLNNQLGSEGAAYIAVALARGCNLTSLNISGCGILPGPLLKTPTGIWSATSAENPPTCGDILARAIGLAKTPLRSLDISVNNIGSPSDNTLSNAICLSFLLDVNLRRSGMSTMAVAIAESAAAAQRLRRETEKGYRFKKSAGRVLHARRVAKGMNIEADPILLAQQLSSRPSIVSIASAEEGTYNIQTQPLPSDFGFIPILKSPLPSSRASSITGPPTSRRSSHHMVLEPVMEVRRTALVRRGSDGSLINPRSANKERHIKIYLE